jgi:tetratricopeptide (TPR) repeat protein
VIAAATLAAYSGSFRGPFVFDDVPAIVQNPTLRRLASAWAPPLDTTASGRPLLNVSFAVNFLAGGLAPAGYHLANLAIHVAAALVLFGLVRRTAELWNLPAAAPIAFAGALLWALHPLQTEAVTYIAQRAESMMGLFYLLTLYCFLRGWRGLAVAACLAGMATKEVMVSAPVLVFCFDRTFVAGGFREAWRRRRSFYAALAATWLLLAALVFASHGRNGDVGFGSGVSWVRYALAQVPALLRYLSLAAWPHPLVFDYGLQWIAEPARIMPQFALLAALVAAPAVAFFHGNPRIRAAGFLGLAFWAFLAPTALVPGNRQTAAEHRMYLSLAPLAIAAVVWASRRLGRGSAPALAAVAAALGALTWARNADYRSALRLWSDTVAKNPANAYAQINLGNALEETPSRQAKALPHYQVAVRLRPDLPEAHNDLGNALARGRRLADAADELKKAAALNPDVAETHNNLANVLNAEGRTMAAVGEYEAAIRLRPDYPEAHLNLGITLLHVPGREAEGVAHIQTAAALAPDLPLPREILSRLGSGAGLR